MSARIFVILVFLSLFYLQPQPSQRTLVYCLTTGFDEMEGERRVVCITCTRSVLRDRNRHHLTRDYLEDNPGFTEYVMERININEVSKNLTVFIYHTYDLVVFALAVSLCLLIPNT